MINYFLLLAIRILINFADSLFYIVSIWMISSNFDNPLYTGMAVSIFMLPEAMLIFVGPIIDKVSPKKILLASIVTQILAVVILLFYHAKVGLFVLYILLFVSSFGSAISYPLEDTLIPNIVEKNRIVEANSGFYIAYEVVDAIFNGISGFLLVVFSYKKLYGINLAMLLLTLVPIYMFRCKRQNKKGFDGYSLKEYYYDLKEGIHYVGSSFDLLLISLPLVVINLYNAINATTLPYYCTSFSNPEMFFGFITMASGIGGVIGGAVAGVISRKVKSGNTLYISLFLKGFFWIIAVLINNMYFALAAFGFSYAFSAINNMVFSAFFQLYPPSDMIGRVNTIIDTLITIAMPIGGVLGGYLLSIVSPKVIYAGFGIFVILVSMLFKRKKIIEAVSGVFN